MSSKAYTIVILVGFVLITSSGCCRALHLRDYVEVLRQSQPVKTFQNFLRARLPTSSWKDKVTHRLDAQDYSNDAPLIGVLTEPCTGKECDFGKSIIAGPVVEWVHSAGGRVVPIRYYDSDDWLERMFNAVNGIIFPGGGVKLWWDSPYFVAASKLWKMAKKENDNGGVFPLFGICLGFELMHILEANRTADDVLVPTDAEGFMDYLQYTWSAQSSVLFRDFPHDLYSKLGEPHKNLAYMAHVWGVPPSAYKKYPKLQKFFNVLSTTTDRNGVEYVSSVEAYDYPFFGSQWHPEKPPYEFSDRTIKHNRDTVRLGYYMANAFVDVARLSNHKVKYVDQLDITVYNFKPSYTARDDIYHLGPNPDILYFIDPPVRQQTQHNTTQHPTP